MNATVNVVCYKSKTLSNGEHPLMIRVCKNGKTKYQSLGISVNPKYWDFKKGKPKNTCPNKELILKIILEKETSLQKQILEFNSDQKNYSAFSLLDFTSEKVCYQTVSEFYIQLIKELNESGRRGNALVHKNSYNSLNRFTKNKLGIYFSEIDVKWLEEYERWMKECGCKETSMGIFLRTLRSVYNKAIKAKVVSKNSYPFNEFKISKFNVKTQKRAISKEDILKIIKLEVDEKKFYLSLAKDIFVFSYLCGGINFTDIAYLTSQNIQNQKLLYTRKKTGKIIKISLRPEALKFIQKYSARESQTGFLFPILDKNIHKTQIQQYHRIRKVLRKINKNLKKISEVLNLCVNLTTYVARHTYATVLKNSGVNVILIGETLGHSDIKTTQIYLDSFTDNEIEKALENLL